MYWAAGASIALFSPADFVETDRILEAAEDGVTALDAADTGPLPFGLDAVTVKVYVVPFARPVTIPVVGAGVPVMMVGVCGVEPM